MNPQTLPTNLKSLPNNSLLEQTERLAADERRITTQVLWHLHEIERRMLFAELGFPSLFEYCTQVLKYSSAGAHRRIASMRLLKQMPEIESKIDSGELNVTALSQAQTVFRQAKIDKKPFTLESKRELIRKLENKGSRECEKILAETNPVEHRTSKQRVVAANRTEIRFEADDALYAKIKLLQGKHAHKLKGSNDFADLLEILLDAELARLETKPVKPKQLVPAPEANDAKAHENATDAPDSVSRYVSKTIQTRKREESADACSFIDPVTQRRCGSRFALEFDHIQPLALGGRTEASNIRLLCRTHNRLAAVKAFGIAKIESYLNQE